MMNPELTAGKRNFRELAAGKRTFRENWQREEHDFHTAKII
jgi:hypothetical protein